MLTIEDFPRKKPNTPSRKTGYILSLGKITLGTGSSKLFNVYEIWGEDSTYEIYKDVGLVDKYRIVVTAGQKPLHKVGDKVMFVSSKPSRTPIFLGEMVEYAVGTNLKELKKKYGSSLLGYTYK